MITLRRTSLNHSCRRYCFSIALTAFARTPVMHGQRGSYKFEPEAGTCVMGSAHERSLMARFAECGEACEGVQIFRRFDFSVEIRAMCDDESKRRRRLTSRVRRSRCHHRCADMAASHDSQPAGGMSRRHVTAGQSHKLTDSAKLGGLA